jgi:CRISPR-associated protein Csm2
MNLMKIDEIEEKVKNSRITTTQLRLLLSNSAVIKNKIELENLNSDGDKLSDELVREINYLLVKHIYQCGRERNVKYFDSEFKISNIIKDIKDSRKKFNDFYRYLETIVAYSKFYRE